MVNNKSQKNQLKILIVMENQILYSSEFTEHHGRFPYIIHRMFYGIYRQIPILFSENHEPNELPGVTIRLQSDAHHWPEVVQSHHMQERLLEALREMKRDLDVKYKRDARLCLVFSPTSCVYISADKEAASDAPPAGGTLCSADGKPMLFGVRYHWRESDFQPFLYRKN
jgi:hypothetical protein